MPRQITFLPTRKVESLPRYISAYFWEEDCDTSIKKVSNLSQSWLQDAVLQSDKWVAGIKFFKPCTVKECKLNCSRTVLNIYDHIVAVSDQKRDGGSSDSVAKSNEYRLLCTTCPDQETLWQRTKG